MTFREKAANAVEKGWIWLYHLSQRHLPEGWYDEVWALFVDSRLKELRGYVADDVLLILVQDLEDEGIADRGREMRSGDRELRATDVSRYLTS